MPTLVIPVEAIFQFYKDSFSIRYDGDVVLEQLFGKRLESAEVTGNLTIRTDQPISGKISAGGKLILIGRVEAESLRGREIVLETEEVRCRSIYALERIEIGPAVVIADVLIAPEIRLDAKTSGRVRIIESHNDPGPTKIKGGFTLREFSEEFGNGVQFLKDLGLEPLPGGPTQRALASPSLPPEPLEVQNPAGQARQIRRTPSPGVRRNPTRPESPTEPLFTHPISMDEISSPPSRTDVQSEVTERYVRPAPLLQKPQPPAPDQIFEEDNHEESLPIDPDDIFHPHLLDALARVLTSYGDFSPPAPIAPLREWIAGKRYDRLRQELAEIWYDVLTHHRMAGTSPPRGAAHGFRMIHRLVQSS